MSLTEIANTVANIHNILSEISVRGDDTIRMGNVLQTCRQLVQQIMDEQNKQEQESEATKEG